MEISYICLGIIVGMTLGGYGMYRFQLKMKTVYYKKVSNDQRYLAVLNQWLILKQDNMQIADVLKKKKIRHIAIYGMGIYGRHLIRELENTEIVVDYGIDKKATNSYKGILIRKPNEQLEEVDAVVNTVVWGHTEIENQLVSKYTCAILNLEDIVFERFRLYNDNHESRDND